MPGSVIVVAFVAVVAIVTGGAVSVVVGALLSVTGSDWKGRGDRNGSGEKLRFMVKKSLVNFSNRRRCVFSFDLIHDDLILIRKSLKYKLDLIFMIHGFAKDG